MQFTGTILEVTSGNYKDNDWAKVIIKSDDVANGKMLTYKCHVKSFDTVNDIIEKEGHNCVIQLGIFSDGDKNAIVKVIGLD